MLKRLRYILYLSLPALFLFSCSKEEKKGSVWDDPSMWYQSEIPFLDSSLPAASGNPGTINAGDIMLYGNNCVVVFYETFNTSYSYTRIGRIKNTANLKKALGSGNVEVTFE